MIDLVDTHCHIHFNDYPLPADEVIAAAKDVGVNRILCVGTTLADSRLATEFVADKAGLWATVGVHPYGAAQFVVATDAGKLAELAGKPKVVAIGETGLDYHRGSEFKLEQERALRAHIETGLAKKLPYVFHVREAWDDFWRIFDEYKGLSGVVHSFSSGRAELDEVLNHGLYVGLNGIMSFTHDRQQLQAAKAVPAEKLLFETDAPFLTPKPFRGKTCEPKHVAAVAEFLADLRNESVAQLAKVSTRNALALFSLKEKNA